VVGLLIFSLSAIESKMSDYDRMYRTFFMFSQMPLTMPAAINQGWYPFTKCNNNLGIAFSSSSGGPTKTSPGFLYFTSAGQLAGFGIRVYSSSVPQNIIPKYWVPVPGQTDQYDISLIFRSSEYMCTNKTNSYILGDQISVGNKYPIPQTSDEATSQGWVAGACIPEMGIHYSLDVTSPGHMTWNASNLFPVMPMYGVKDKEIKAVSIVTPSWQDTIPFGEFEGPVNNAIFCYNWCPKSGCTFSGTHVWSTFHWLFTDYKEVSCTNAPCW